MSTNQISFKLEYQTNQYKTIFIPLNTEPERVAYEFCKENNLDYDNLLEITNKIRNFLSTLTSPSEIASRSTPQSRPSTTSKKKHSKPKQGPMFYNEIISTFSGNLTTTSKRKPLIQQPNTNNNHTKETSDNNIEHIYKMYPTESSVKKEDHIYYNKLITNSTPSKSITSGYKNNNYINNPVYYNANIRDEEIQPINYGERLYRKGMKLREKSKRNLEIKQSKIEKENKQQLTFKPKINAISYTMLSKRINNHKACTDEQTILNYSTVMTEKLNSLKNKHNIPNEQKPTFKPCINKNSIMIDSKRKAVSPDYRVDRHMKLYNDKNKQKISLANLTNQLYNKNNMFKPHINKDYIFPGYEKPFEERQKYYEEKSKEKKKKTIREIMSSENTSFRPVINNNSNYCYNNTLNNERNQNLTFNDNVFEQLYEKGKFYERMKQEKMNTLYNYERQPLVTKKSNEMIDVRNRKKFEELFYIIDKVGNGILNIKNFDLKGIRVELQEIFQPVKEELENENLTLNLKEFIEVCIHLYNNSSYYEKQLFLNPVLKEKEGNDKGIGNKNFTFKPKVNENIPINGIEIRKNN